MNPKILVRENAWSAITVDSIKANMPDWEPVLVKKGATGVIATALDNADGITMCVRGGQLTKSSLTNSIKLVLPLIE